MLLLVGQLRLDGSSDSVSRRVAPSRRQLRLAMRSISMQFRQLLLVGQLRLDGSSHQEITRVILCRLIYIVMSFKPFNDIIMIVCKFLIGLCCVRSYST